MRSSSLTLLLLSSIGKICVSLIAHMTSLFNQISSLWIVKSGLESQARPLWPMLSHSQKNQYVLCSASVCPQNAFLFLRQWMRGELSFISTINTCFKRDYPFEKITTRFQTNIYSFYCPFSDFTTNCKFNVFSHSLTFLAKGLETWRHPFVCENFCLIFTKKLFIRFTKSLLNFKINH